LRTGYRYRVIAKTRPRLKKVIDGEDQDGISRTVNWKGGGYKFNLLPEDDEESQQ